MLYRLAATRQGHIYHFHKVTPRPVQYRQSVKNGGRDDGT